MRARRCFTKQEDKKLQLTKGRLGVLSACPAESPLSVELQCFVSMVIFRRKYKEGKAGGWAMDEFTNMLVI